MISTAYTATPEKRRLIKTQRENYIVLDLIQETEKEASFKLLNFNGHTIHQSVLIDSEYDTLFSFLFTSKDLREKNRKVFQFLNKYYHNLTIVKKFLNDSALQELDGSILKSALVMVSNIDGIEEERRMLQQLYDSK